MTSSVLFNIVNLYTIPLWALIIVLPNWKITKKIMESLFFLTPIIFTYIYYIFDTFYSGSASSLGNFELQDIADFFSNKSAAGSGWVHFLVVDLFVGRWIYWQGQEKEIWTIHSLILCVFLAPVGLLSHIITAYFFDKNNNSDDDNSDVEEAKTDIAVS